MRRVKIILGSLLGLILLTVLCVYAISSYRLNRRYPVPEQPPIILPDDTAALARGGHIATSFGLCTECHGDDFGGKLYLDAGPLGKVYGPNLTRGVGGVGNQLTDADWIKAIRHGLRRDGASLLVMPSEKFAYLADDDLAALVAYAKQLSPVDRQVPETELYFVGRALMALGKLPLLAAEKVRPVPPLETIDQKPSVAYGLYLANVASCRGCHRPDLAGGPMEAPGAPPASNLTRAALGRWQEADFVRAMRMGKRPDGTLLHPIMPWQRYRNMTDDELRSLWLYLRSVPAKT